MKLIKYSEIKGSVAAPASKSVSQRAIFAAALAEGESLLSNVSFCADCAAALEVAAALGATVRWDGVPWESVLRITGGMKPVLSLMSCGESGLCLRISCALAALHSHEITLTASGSLLKRPVSMIEEPLKALGVSVSSNSGYPPVKICGPLKGGKAQVDGSQSSQFLSGLIMALTLCANDSEIAVSGLESRPYVLLTLQVLRDFGLDVTADRNFSLFKIKGGQQYRPRHYAVEGDWSGAACLLVAGAIAGEVTITNLKAQSEQADKALVQVLGAAGALVETGEDYIKVAGGRLKAFAFDASQCPDLVPALAVLAANCSGQSVITGVRRLVIKESNRLAALLSELGIIGAAIRSPDNDTLEIEGSELHGGIVSSHNDHRIAMACAVAALRSKKGVTIQDEHCVAKSYPGFFDDLAHLMVNR